MHFLTNLPEVHPISRAKINPQLCDSCSYTSGIAQIAALNAIDSIPHDTTGPRVECLQPLDEGFSTVIRLADEDFSRAGIQSMDPRESA